VSFVPEALFIAAVLPIYYLVIAWLSRSKYINEEVTDFPWEWIPGMKQGGTSREVAVSSSIQVGTIVLVMSGVLLGMLLILQFTKNFHEVLIVGLDWLILNFFFGSILNPRLSKRVAMAGVTVATVLIVLRFNWSNYWILNGPMSLLGTTAILMLYRNIPLRAILVLSAGLVIYDVFNVYGTGLMEDTVNQMSDRARTSAMMTIPKTITPTSAASSIVGLGDILFPGLWITLAARTSNETNQRRVLLTTILGTTIGWVGSAIILHLTHTGVPALMTILPCAATGYLLGKPRKPNLAEDQLLAA